MSLTDETIKKLNVLFNEMSQIDEQKRMYRHDKAVDKLSRTKTRGLMEVELMLTLAACELAQACYERGTIGEVVGELAIALEPLVEMTLDELTIQADALADFIADPAIDDNARVIARICLAANHIRIYLKVTGSAKRN